MADVFGQAIKAFYESEDESLEIEVFSDLAGDEHIPVSYFFREGEDLPDVEQKALSLSKGKILDIGAGAGTHTLHLLEQGKEVVALEKSQLCCDVMEERGVNEIIQDDFYAYTGEKYDTILLLMNGIGIAGTNDKLPAFLNHCKSLLNKNGRILIESSDIIYMFEDEDGSYLIDLNAGYYGNMNYTIQFDSDQENFDWLYAAYDILADVAEICGMKAKKVMDGEHYNYLAELTII